MIVKNAKFSISAVSPKDYPKGEFQEIVLVGKSNVGKSSFINTLCNRKNLARTSNVPGKTRQINFYDIDKKFYLVDLPGYGYSKMSKEEQLKSGKFIEQYLSIGKNISLIVLLLDIRHNPTQDDILMYNYILSTNLPFIVVTNKADKIAITKVDSNVDRIKKILGISYSTIIPFSSERKIYTDRVWKEFEKILNIN
ncbi:MAG: YihA family ribosome biogenesis GTP-binding protein [Clostridia bacterium]|nr:YihA family ribosome biogenesis GTP-binding protein [Clostridia bacterium]